VRGTTSNALKHCSQANDCGRGTGEVTGVEGADDSAGQEDGVEEERSLVAVANLDQLEPREKKEADHDCRESFKEAFDRRVNYPPAPVFSVTSGCACPYLSPAE